MEEVLAMDDLDAVIIESEELELVGYAQQFAEKGLVQRTVGDDGVAYYALPEEHRHQHQLTCSRCGASVPVEGCPVEALASRLAVTTGFQITGHRLELYGLCPKCAESKEEYPYKEEVTP